ncbi:TPA: hypothetical protein ACXRZ0_001731 [Klebsiella pneumoniae]|uniref:hypothetical protein n=1 Tax=Klebsiella pneumoniae TaxID=573 RepID=UPI00094962EE|nr:hypothetical protein [Klebsiella pneumoniae]HCA9725801.1 hypothetical protein [Klebsiella pneumoniae]HDH0899210.1 hypothetical protein [Klebsiella pneumoniae]HDY8390827.1 hypothetical protein [Klebsiella pneumoniae]
MIPELSAAMTAVKETFGLVKVISSAKTDAEVKAATFELQSKLLTLQTECFALGDAIRLKDEEVTRLKAVIANLETFKTDVEGYVLEKLESGTFVYSKQELVKDSEITVQLCARCYDDHVKSILHSLPISQSDKFHTSRCLHCNNEFSMNRNPAYVRQATLEEIGRLLNG